MAVNVFMWSAGDCFVVLMGYYTLSHGWQVDLFDKINFPKGREEIKYDSFVKPSRTNFCCLHLIIPHPWSGGGTGSLYTLNCDECPHTLPRREP